MLKREAQMPLETFNLVIFITVTVSGWIFNFEIKINIENLTECSPADCHLLCFKRIIGLDLNSRIWEVPSSGVFHSQPVRLHRSHSPPEIPSSVPGWKHGELNTRLMAESLLQGIEDIKGWVYKLIYTVPILKKLYMIRVTLPLHSWERKFSQDCAILWKHRYTVNCFHRNFEGK